MVGEGQVKVQLTENIGYCRHPQRRYLVGGDDVANGGTLQGSKGNFKPAGGLFGRLDWLRTLFAGAEGT